MIIVISMATEKPMMTLMDERQIAHVGFDQLEHADVGRNPRQGAEAEDQDRSLDVARRLAVGVVFFAGGGVRPRRRSSGA